MDISRRECLKGIGMAGLAVSGGSLVGSATAAANTAQEAGGALIAQNAPHTQHSGTCIWISPEDFSNLGGWRLDSQFLHLMGSSYLIARGIGTPVSDASVDVALETAGRFRVWARMRDWLPEFHPGQFQLLIDGDPLPRTLGVADRDDWHWAIAGDIELTSGSHRIALHDLSGSFARCSAIIVTNDANYVPPYGAQEVMHERLRLTGVSTEPRDLGRFDVVVVGGGPAGCPAAIAAARMHVRTALVHDRPVLGGNASTELGVPPEGAALIQRNARETGIIEEATRLQVQQDLGHVTVPFEALAAAEPDLTVILNTRVLGVEMAAPGRIQSLLGVDMRDGSPVRIGADYFIDCTGDGWIGYFAGAQYRIGWEARWEHNEPDAPEQPDLTTMSGTLMGPFCFWAEDAGEPVPYTPPPWAAELPDLAAMKRTPTLLYTGEWWLETPGDRDDLYETERVRDELIRISFGYFHYIKNVWAERARTANYRLTDVPHMLAKRETRRLVADYMLTMNDILGDTRFPDAVAYAGWPLDIHNPAGIYGGPEGPYYCNHLFEGLRQIPLGSLYSANVDNLLVAGRCAGVTRLALGAVRVERTLATMGQAVGTAAALCVRHACTPRTVRAEHIAELQQTLLKYDQYIPFITNQDLADLARSASVTASSAATGERLVPERMSPSAAYHPLDGHRRALMVPVMHGQGVKTVSTLLRSTLLHSTQVQLHLREAAAPTDFTSTQDLAVAQAELPPDGEHWVLFAFDAPTAADYIWFWLEAAEGVSWRLAESALPGSRRAYAVRGADGPDAWVVRPESYACRVDPAPEIRLDYSPANVISGVSRVLDDEKPNMWRSHPDEPMPQWVELDFGRPTAVNTVHLAFGTDLNSRRLRRATDPATGVTGLSSVAGYEIQTHGPGGWETRAKVEDNCQRWRRHRFDRVTTQRLRVLTTHLFMMDSAQVYEIRAYDEA